jgi:hypothetical protein
MFEFVRERNHTRWCRELVENSPYGIDAQIFRNEQFSYGCRFPNRPLRRPGRIWDAN